MAPAAKYSKQQGFTLLEILLVVAIVGIIASLATMTIPGEDFEKKTEREIRKLAAQISLLQDEAIVQSRELGVELWQNGYRFWGWQAEQGWNPISEDLDFQNHLLIDDAELSLNLAGQPVALDIVPVKGFPTPKPKASSSAASSAPAAPDFSENMPHIVLFSSGETTAYEISLIHADSFIQWRLQGDIIGQQKISSQVID